MPSAFETAMADNLPDGMFEAFGLPAVYTPVDGSDAITGITVIIDRQDPSQVPRESGAVVESQRAIVRVQVADVAKPVSGGRFTVEGIEVWTIDATPLMKNGQHYCNVTRTSVNRLMERRGKSDG